MKCDSCGIDKDESEFPWRIKGEARRHKCKDCTNAYSREQYAKKESYRKKAYGGSKKRRNRNRAFILDYLQKHPCADCGENDIRVLEFDHIDNNKESGISVMVMGGYSIEHIKKEIDKCQVRCANCHRKRHHINSYRNI